MAAAGGHNLPGHSKNLASVWLVSGRSSSTQPGVIGAAAQLMATPGTNIATKGS
jgi:hypothetical protein